MLLLPICAALLLFALVLQAALAPRLMAREMFGVAAHDSAE